MVRSERGPLWIIGWREWLSLPELGIPEIKVKIDTGARSSALHAFDLERFSRRGHRMVRFTVHPYQRDTVRSVRVEAELHDERPVRDSGGHVEQRPVILTSVRMLERTWEVELTLTNRDEMGFRMLLGRQGLRGQFVIDPNRSFLCGKPQRRLRKRAKKEKET